MPEYFNPNTLGSCSQPDPVHQAEVLERIMLSVKGTSSLADTAAAAVLIDRSSTRPGKLLALPRTTFPKCQETSPKGTWALMVANMFTPESVHDDHRFQDAVAYSILSGDLPDDVEKIAIIASNRVRWVSGIGLLLEAGIYLIDDFGGLFCWAQYDPAMIGIRGNWYAEEAGIISAQRSEELGDDVMEALARDYAKAMIFDFDMSRQMRSAVGKGWSPALTLGEMVDEEELEQLCQDSTHMRNHFLPPEGHISREVIRRIGGICAIQRGWNGYLERFGVRIGSGFQPNSLSNLRHCLENLADSEMRQLVQSACSGVEGRLAVIQAAYEMALAGDIPEDLVGMKSNEASSRKPFAAGAAGWDSTRKLYPGASSQRQEEALSKADLELTCACAIKNGYKIGRRIASGPCYYRAGSLWERVTLSDDANHSDITIAGSMRWGAILVSHEYHGDNEDALYKGVLASGMANDVDFVTTLIWHEELPEDKAAEIIAAMEDGGIRIIASYGGYLGYPPIPEMRVVEAMGIGRRGRKRLVLASRESVDPGILDALSSSARNVMMQQVLFTLGRSMQTPTMAFELMPILSAGRFATGVSWEVEEIEDQSLIFLLDVMEPLGEFFDCDGDGLRWVEKTVDLWERVLALNGLNFSQGFPVGVSRSCFKKLSDILGMESYLGALYDGVDIDDLAPALD